MTNDQLLIVVPVVTALLGVIGTYLVTHRTIKRQEQADLMMGYSQLCDDYRAAIALNNEEIARLRQELGDLKCRFEAEREAWRREREALQARIAELEAINARLERERKAFEAKADGKGC